MVKMTMIAHVTAGLPLAGLDDGRDLRDAEMYKQQVKALFKNLSKGHEASRMSVETGPYVFHSGLYLNDVGCDIVIHKVQGPTWRARACAAKF